jgi:hypothetical protein
VIGGGFEVPLKGIEMITPSIIRQQHSKVSITQTKRTTLIPELLNMNPRKLGRVYLLYLHLLIAFLNLAGLSH